MHLRWVAEGYEDTRLHYEHIHCCLLLELDLNRALQLVSGPPKVVKVVDPTATAVGCHARILLPNVE